jgi:hypothetical protein
VLERGKSNYRNEKAKAVVGLEALIIACTVGKIGWS